MYLPLKIGIFYFVVGKNAIQRQKNLFVLKNRRTFVVLFSFIFFGTTDIIHNKGKHTFRVNIGRRAAT